MNLCVIVGTRGEVIGMAPVVYEIKERNISLLFIHTGQHYDHELHHDLMKDLELPEPNHSLRCDIGGHDEQISSILEKVGNILRRDRPDMVLVQGNNNSTVASAIACLELGIPLGHIESGIRHGYHLGDTNRRIVERCADWRFAPFEEAVRNLRSEGIHQAVHMVGDTYLDAFRLYSEKILNSSKVEELNLEGIDYAVVSIHTGLNRRTEILQSLLETFNSLEDHVFVWTLHPSIREGIHELCSKIEVDEERIIFLPPLPYSDFQKLINSSKLVITDSGITQEEAYLNAKPCIALVSEEIKFSPYPMLVRRGWIKSVASVYDLLDSMLSSLSKEKAKHDNSIFGDGHASERIIDTIESDLGQRYSNKIQHNRTPRPSSRRMPQSRLPKRA